MSVSDAECYTSAALAGCGLIQVPRFRLQAHLQAGRLVQVLADWPCPDLPVCALYPFHRQLSPRVRVLLIGRANCMAKNSAPEGLANLWKALVLAASRGVRG